MDGWMDRWMDGWEWMDGIDGGCVCMCISPSHIYRFAIESKLGFYSAGNAIPLASQVYSRCCYDPTFQAQFTRVQTNLHRRDQYHNDYDVNYAGPVCCWFSLCGEGTKFTCNVHITDLTHLYAHWCLPRWIMEFKLWKNSMLTIHTPLKAFNELEELGKHEDDQVQICIYV
jgi:hypothetical protein